MTYTEQEIVYYDKLIAEFMGADIPSYSKNAKGVVTNCSLVYNNHRVDYFYINDKWSAYGDLFKFSKSWDYLMPVVDKIETMETNVMIKRNYCNIRTWDYDDFTCTGFSTVNISHEKIEATYCAIIYFIKWYNQKS